MPAPAADGALPLGVDAMDAAALRAAAAQVMAQPGNLVTVRVVNQLRDGTLAVEDALPWLLGQPGAALAEVMRQFPGKLVVDAFSHDAPSMRVTDMGTLPAALVRMGPAACALTLAVQEHNHARAARHVAVLLAEHALAPGVSMLCAHRLGDPEPRVAFAAAQVLRHLLRVDDGRASEARRVLGFLCQCLEVGQPWQKMAALRAASVIHDRAFVRPLLDLLHGPMAADAHEALKDITCQDPGDTSKAWARWWQDHAQHCRVEWLVASVEQGPLPLARSAWRSLERITGHHVPGNLDSRAARKAVALDWQSWWAAHGKDRDWP
jgi:hypothetical protein